MRGKRSIPERPGEGGERGILVFDDEKGIASKAKKERESESKMNEPLLVGF